MKTRKLEFAMEGVSSKPALYFQFLPGATFPFLVER